jgi:2-polyprenyl-3-methyl-5-hydroxy-6-metoxy-1,4-benzoquinol methylase
MVTPEWGPSADRYDAGVASPVLGLIARGARVLDLGCASGAQARLLVEHGCTVVGVEVDAVAAERARAWCERVIVCDVDVADLPSELGADTFDVVAAGDFLEHLRDPLRLLRSIAPLLRDGGTVVASIPNVAHGSVRLALLTGSFAYQETGLLDRTHLRFFTLTGIEELFAAAGFGVERVERVHVPIDQGVPYDRSLLPVGVEAAVAAMPEATTFQFVVLARPATGASASRPQSSRLRRWARRSRAARGNP